MTGNAKKRIRRFVGSAIGILILCGVNTFAMQEKISPLSDYQYKRDFPQYDAIKKEADTQKRADLLLGFIKDRPISKILLYAVNDYLACVNPLAKNDMAKVISMEESLLALIPTEKAAQDADAERSVAFIKEQLIPAQRVVLSALVQAHYQSKNWPKAAEAAEKIYAIAPDKALLPVLADIYSKFNADKYLEYGKKILAETPIDQPQGFSTALQMAQAYIQKQDISAATEMFSKVMDVYGDKVPPDVPEAQWNATRAVAYGVIATGVYAKKDYAKAQELYEKVAKFDSKRDDAYYFIGMSKWQNKDPEGAIDSFAKCVVLNKTYAKRAQQYLEDLYKARHGDSLDGLDKVLAKAKSDLGIS
jgi:tetratricopeptide (TPR) repeat protein